MPVFPLVASTMTPPGLSSPRRSAALDDGEADAVLHRPAGVQVLRLAEDRGAQPARDPAQADERRPADRPRRCCRTARGCASSLARISRRRAVRSPRRPAAGARSPASSSSARPRTAVAASAPAAPRRRSPSSRRSRPPPPAGRSPRSAGHQHGAPRTSTKVSAERVERVSRAREPGRVDQVQHVEDRVERDEAQEDGRDRRDRGGRSRDPRPAA